MPTVAQQAETVSTSKIASVGDAQPLGYRIVNWKTWHFNDAAKAQKHLELLQSLKCEVRTAQHQGHTDVKSRTVYWKSLALESEEQLQQWKKWFTANGFEVLHSLPAGESEKTAGPDAKLEVVQYRKPQWGTQHAESGREAGQFALILTCLGCEVKTVKHSGHDDVQFRCSDWREINLPNHQAAHRWQQFLKDAGFETSHQH